MLKSLFRARLHARLDRRCGYQGIGLSGSGYQGIRISGDTVNGRQFSLMSLSLLSYILIS
jgi:hypothetical protein